MKKYNLLIVTGIIIICLFSAGFIAGRSSAGEGLEAKLDLFLEALSLVKTSFVDKNVDDTKLIYGAIKGMLAATEDPYTRFMEPTAYKEMRIRLRGQYSGIGIYIGIKENQLTAISIIPGTPAEKSGLKAKDKIMKIEGVSTKDMSLEEAVSKIRGPKGSKVRLAILRGSAKEPKDYIVMRDNIVVKSTQFKMVKPAIAYIKLNTFEKQTAPQEVSKAIYEARKKNARGLILDLRNNGGGLLDNAISIGSMFIKSGAIVQTVDRDGTRDVKYSTGNVIWWQPLVVLINEGSASASEILAGALQDHKVATLVGHKSFGKASVQSVRVLQDNSAVLITIAKYLTPNGHDITKKGIQPDVVVEIPTKEGEAKNDEPEMPEEEEKDPQLDRAIEIIENQL